jgi:putative flippase GtrA
MKKTRQLVTYLYNHHFIRYLFVGGTTFIIDVGTLVLLHGKFKVNIAVATSIAYWLSVTYNFTLNRWWTFSASESKKLHQHIAAYSVLLGCNYLFTVIFVSIVSRHINYTIAKTIAVILQTTWTYPVYKHIIFTGKKEVPDSNY